MFYWISKQLADYTILDEMAELMCIYLAFVIIVFIAEVIDIWISNR